MANKATSTNWVNIVGWLVILAIIAGVIFAVISSNNQQTELLSTNLEVTEADHVKGSLDSGIVIVEYGDYQCPFCGIFHPITEQIASEYGDRIAFVYRQFPLTTIHANALAASKATEAAALQDKFWEMHNAIFRTQQEWSDSENATEIFAGFAEDLGLDMDKYSLDLNSDTVITKINNDRRIAEDIGVDSTPTVFINGREIAVPSSVDGLKTLIEQEMGNN